MTSQSYDVIIVGAGSAGCALAARLSEDNSRRVLLLEAGPRYLGQAKLPDDLRYAGLLKAMVPGNQFNWEFNATLTDRVQQPLPRGRVVGGSSAVNGAVFTRGLPRDFDGWASQGNTEWTFEKVLPFFKRMESDHDLKDEFHGDHGPVPVRRGSPAEWPKVAHAFLSACQSAGHPHDADMNAPDSIGVGAIPTNAVEGVRVNAALAYLDPASNRTNLEVRSETTVQRVVLKNGRAVGVEVGGVHETSEVVFADEVVLCAGAVKSPQILLISGIGPADDLRKFNIPVAVESPMVGRQFTDHCTVGVGIRLKKREQLDPRKTTWVHTGLHYSSDVGGSSNDMLLLQSSIPLNRTMFYKESLLRRARALQAAVGDISPRKLYHQVRYGWDQGISVILMQGDSRGELSLVDSDPATKPVMKYNYLSSSADRQRLRDGMRLAAGLVDDPAYAELGASVIFPGKLADASDEALDSYIAEHVGTSIHMASTCRMDSARERGVVDQFCRVHGVDGLRVVDTSIMPSVVSRCPAASAIMLGERASAFFA